MEKKKIGKMGELSYIFATVLMALGTVMSIKADLGMSMIAAPAYCLSTWMGMYMGYGEYIFQGVLLLLFFAAVQRIKWQYCLCFVTALFYGSVVNLLQFFVRDWVPTSLVLRIVLFVLGALIVSLSVALYFRTYLPLSVYELFVKGLCDRYHLPTGRTKTFYDLASLALSVVLAILVFGVFGAENLKTFGGIVASLRSGGVYIGTVVIAFTNGLFISLFGKLLDRFVTFEPRFPKLYKILSV